MATPLVLIVDDEYGLCELFARLVGRLGYGTLTAQSGAEALAILEDHTPDLIVLDIAMPGMRGTDVLRRIVEIPRLDAMRVIVLTAIGPGPAPDDVAFRIDKWVNKPVNPGEFLDLVRALVEATG